MIHVPRPVANLTYACIIKRIINKKQKENQTNVSVQWGGGVEEGGKKAGTVVPLSRHPRAISPPQAMTVYPSVPCPV